MTTPDWTSEIVEAIAREFRDSTVCGCSINGKNVFCDDVRLPENLRMSPPCDCKKGAQAALIAALPMILEKAAKECDEQAQDFLSPQYATHQPLSSLGERFACSQCATRILALTEPKDNGGEND